MNEPTLLDALDVPLDELDIDPDSPLGRVVARILEQDEQAGVSAFNSALPTQRHAVD